MDGPERVAGLDTEATDSCWQTPEKNTPISPAAGSAGEPRSARVPPSVSGESFTNAERELT